MDDWQPIETAPKDGSFVIGACESHWGRNWTVLRFPYPLRARWDGKKWRADDDHVYDPQPTHWRADGESFDVTSLPPAPW